MRVSVFAPLHGLQDAAKSESVTNYGPFAWTIGTGAAVVGGAVRLLIERMTDYRMTSRFWGGWRVARSARRTGRNGSAVS